MYKQALSDVLDQVRLLLARNNATWADVTRLLSAAATSALLLDLRDASRKYTTGRTGGLRVIDNTLYRTARAVDDALLGSTALISQALVSVSRLANTRTAYMLAVQQGGYETLSGKRIPRALVPIKTHTDQVKKPWSGQTYEERHEENTRRYKTAVHREIVRGIIQGQGVDTISQRVTKVSGQAYNDAVRLVRTESNFALNNATLLSFIKAGVDRYEYLATLDNRTSELCRAADGKTHKVTDARPGVNYPPLHPNCRSTVIPVIDSTYARENERSARSPNVHLYYVPADMTYADWQARTS